ncbi:hypothetical protein [Rhizobium sp. NFACC06-2]|uniref:hypothetical protein n=1 Tax=Rhizobium sp. NFACC06-2 TaxID=1566264 RepID=UPI00165ED72E|nr:hypothetical protein [Rhizobium sp. NFACC06-2]
MEFLFANAKSVLLRMLKEGCRRGLLLCQSEQREDHHAGEGYDQYDVERTKEIEALPVRKAESIDMNTLVKLQIVHAAIDGKITAVILVKSVFPDLRDNLVSRQKNDRHKRS